jgi:hypothetical protein
MIMELDRLPRRFPRLRSLARFLGLEEAYLLFTDDESTLL